ncbi:MAG TPA: enoyl-CoA hydratase/isomerase family protein [Geminicoccus sp.]|jgi:enoyl-CoA hydratase/carnithine racemase|uniref:enoyl-CoA hydratase/isomerase family protein n=1 Tax=Geminicoccus sp. TaxID=2024832 RepID=UPI002E3418F8|nr:enoyl-CoA hydratase/isomerase family protein [Geminicoccus sp.]HEX2525155.1 enoyl-CoA hydratase/isomerase family protein [Geminicoccus sp.]
MSTGDITLAIDGPIALVTLVRPDKLNALTAAMLDRLHTIADQLDAEDAIRAVILTGTGERAFCAGADIADWGSLDPHAFGHRWIRAGNRIFDRWARLRPPVIAALNGATLGGGLELAACADLRIAEAHARFGLPEARIGVIPGWSGTQRLVRRAGSQAVRRLVLTAEPIDATEALRVGLVDELVPTGQSLARAQALAAGMAERAPLALRIAKQLVNAAEGEDASGTLDSLAGSLAAGTDDVREGIAAFKAKRAASFSGR